MDITVPIHVLLTVLKFKKKTNHRHLIKKYKPLASKEVVNNALLNNRLDNKIMPGNKKI